MRWISLFVLLLAQQVHSSEFVKGKGSFVSADGDSYEFIKKQLIHEGVKSIVTKELVLLGLNKDIFWQKYNEKLEEINLVITEDIKRKFNIQPDSKQKSFNRYREVLRRKKLNRRRTFSRMNDMLPKFMIIKISRSQKNKRYRYIKLEGVVDKSLLTKIYYNLVRGKKTSDYGSLYLNVNYDLNGISYAELGIDNENDFEGEVTCNWLEWFVKNKPANIANAELLGESKQEKLQKYLNLPSEVMLNSIPDVFINSLLLDIEVVITKLKHDKKTNVYSFKYEGFAYLKDLQTNLVLGTYKFNKTEKSYRAVIDSSIGNLVANHVYHMATGSFPNIKKRMKNITPVSSIKRISLSNFKNINQVHSFIKLVQSNGIKLSLTAKLESINKERADIIMYFDGEYNEVKSLFSQLQSAKKDLLFEVIDTNNLLGIKFIRVL